MDINHYLAEKKALIDMALDRFLPSEKEKPTTIHRAMRYSVFAGGKRLRPVLVLASAEAVGGDTSLVMPAACAMEMIHTYSLIHDDLPAMDDDDYRRGRLTSHKVFGDAMAILTGDALLTHAFYVLSLCEKTISAHRVNLVVGEIAAAAGTMGMVGGQVADLESQGKEIAPEDLEYIHRNKTGALFTASLRSGAILAGADQQQLEALTAFGQHLGLAFQITDDILDVTGDSSKLGKSTGSDLRKEKATFPGLYGLEQSVKMAKEQSKRAVTIAETLGSRAEPLALLVQYLVSRDH